MMAMCTLANANGSETIVLSEENTIVLASAFTGPSISQLIEDAKNKDTNLKSQSPLYLVLYTPGGFIQAGIEAITYLQGLNRPVHTLTMFAASMGFQTVQHLGKRYIVPYGVLMSHKARGGFQGEFGNGFSQLDSRYGMSLRRIEMMDLQTVKRTNGKQTLTSYRAAYANELWLNGAEAVEQGYADAVVIPRCDSSLSGHVVMVEDLGYMKLSLTFSKCPLNTYPIKVEAIVITNQGEMLLSEFIAKNGRFGQKCLASNSLLCAYDPTLTLQKVHATLEKKKQLLYSGNLKSNIVYSY